MNDANRAAGNPRGTVVVALTEAAAAFPKLEPQELETSQLSPRDARLAVAIHRTVLQRWLTLEHLLDLKLSKPMRLLEPAMRAVLLAGAAQLVFMDRLPPHAVVDESVKLAKRHVRPKAAGMVNAVLRRVAEMVRGRDDAPWSPARDRLPGDGERGAIVLADACLPDFELSDSDALAKHLEVAASHPRRLVKHWIETHGVERAIDLCRLGVRTPPLIVAVEEEFDRERAEAEEVNGEPAISERVDGKRVDGEAWQPHAAPGFIVWRSGIDELRTFLAGHRARRVQDPTSAQPVAAAARELAASPPPSRILDRCAGQGTKTHQLAAAFPAAHIDATDTHAGRLATLRDNFAKHPRASVIEQPPTDASYDLILLDVPCTNTGVLARRPEARYRYSEASLRSLVEVQRDIIEQAIDLLAPQGHLLYATCSIEPAENNWRITPLLDFGFKLVAEQHTLPDADRDTAWRDGGYHALLRKD